MLSDTLADRLCLENVRWPIQRRHVELADAAHLAIKRA